MQNLAYKFLTWLSVLHFSLRHQNQYDFSWHKSPFQTRTFLLGFRFSPALELNRLFLPLSVSLHSSCDIKHLQIIIASKGFLRLCWAVTIHILKTFRSHWQAELSPGGIRGDLFWELSIKPYTLWPTSANALTQPHERDPAQPFLPIFHTTHMHLSVV